MKYKCTYSRYKDPNYFLYLHYRMRNLTWLLSETPGPSLSSLSLQVVDIIGSKRLLISSCAQVGLAHLWCGKGRIGKDSPSFFSFASWENNVHNLINRWDNCTEGDSPSTLLVFFLRKLYNEIDVELAHLKEVYQCHFSHFGLSRTKNACLHL